MAKIDKNQPLPSHTKLSYDECYAKFVLEYCYPERYGTLSVLDKPDLQNRSLDIGVEVTASVSKNFKAAESIGCKLPCLSKDQFEKNCKKLEDLHVEHHAQVLIHPPEPVYFGPTIEMVETKFEKLNSGHYQQLSTYDLFVWVNLFLDDAKTRHELLDKFVSMCDKECNYSFIFIYAIDTLYAFDLCNKQVKCFELKQQNYVFARKARQMVEDAEADQL